jgi:hypothetical protein
MNANDYRGVIIGSLLIGGSHDVRFLCGSSFPSRWF